MVETRNNSLIESNDTAVIYRLVTSEDGIEQYFSSGDTTTSENITGNRGDQSVEHVPFVGTMELLGKWVLDGAYTENANSGLSLRSLFGSALGDYGAELQLSADGSIEYYIGVLTGKGTWHADGDTGRYIAELVVHPDERNETLIFHGFRESPDSKHYLVLNYGDYALYWTQSDTDSSPVAASDLAEDIAYHLELAAGDDFRDMTSEKLAEILAEYNDLLDDYSLIARESTDGKAVYIVGQFNGDPTQSPLYGMYGIELSAGEEEVFQFLYREEQSETVEAALAANKTDFPPSAGYRIEDSRILWSSNGGTVLIQPKDAELLMDVPYNRYLHTPNGREYIADAVSRGIDVCGRTDTFLYVYLISERFGEIAERIALTKEEALAIQAEERVSIIDGFGFSASLHIDGQTIYYNEREGIPQTVLDLAVERCDYRFGDPGMITDTIREARLDCDWLETPLYAKTEDLSRLREILKNAEFGYVGSCGYGAKLSLTFTGGEKLTVFKGTDGCDTIVFGSYGGYFLGDKENTEFWEIFGLDPESKLPQ